MRSLFAVLPTLLIAAASLPAMAEDDFLLKGEIRSFDCGDNCYLTLATADDDTVTALCLAPECAPWNEQAAIPQDLVGTRVTVNVGAGLQFDGGGDVTGAYPAFTSISMD